MFFFKRKIARSADAADTKDEGDITEKRSVEGLSVLMAEDNELNATLTTLLLEESGISVTRASDGREAVSLFADNRPNTYDVILMDINMPNMDGYEATGAIRRMKGRPDGATVPIIALTGIAADSDRKKATSIGMNGYITKPIDKESLLAEIKKLCGVR